jgi:hypothetical protein
LSSIYSPKVPKNYYVYAYLRGDGSPYYIGKGSGKRAWSKNHTIVLPKNKSKIIIMETNLTEIGAFALERFYIQWYGRKCNRTGILRNLTEGGEGGSGQIFSNTHKQKISKALTGRTFSKQHCERISKSKKGVSVGLGKTLSEETKNKIRKTKTGNTFNSAETRRKLSIAMKGKKIHNDEFKQHRKKVMLENNPSKMNRITCLHCGIKLSKSNHTKWHGEKCKIHLSRLQSATEIK